MPIQFYLEILVAVLLVITGAYCFLLNRRLTVMRNGNDGLREIVLSLNEAASKAQDGVEQLRRSSDNLAVDLSKKIVTGRELANELSMIIDSGNNIANRITGHADQSRVEYRKPAPPEALSRLDKAFRRQFSEELRSNKQESIQGAKIPSAKAQMTDEIPAAWHSPNSSTPNSMAPASIEDESGNDLRQALRALR